MDSTLLDISALNTILILRIGKSQAENAIAMVSLVFLS